MPPKTISPEIQSAPAPVEIQQEAQAIIEKKKLEEKEIIKKKLESQQRSEIDNKINTMESNTDIFLNQEQVKGELGVNKTDVEMSTWEKIKEKGGDTAERAKKNWSLIV